MNPEFNASIYLLKIKFSYYNVSAFFYQEPVLSISSEFSLLNRHNNSKRKDYMDLVASDTIPLHLPMGLYNLTQES